MNRTGIFILFFFIWNVSSVAKYSAPDDEKLSVKKICVSEDGRSLFSIQGGTVDFWDMEKTELIKNLKCSSSTLLCISYSDAQNTIVLGNKDGEVIIVKTNDETKLVKLPGIDFVSSVAIADKEKKVFVGTGLGLIYKLDLQDGKIEGQKSIHKKAVTSLAYSSNHDQLISAGADGLVKVIKGDDLSESHVVQKGNGWIRDLCLSKDESILVTGNDAGKVHKYRISSGGDYKLINKSGQYSDWITGVDMIENDLIALASFSGNIRINFKFGSYRKKLKHRINDLCLIPGEGSYMHLAIATVDNGVIFLDSREMKLISRK